MTTKALAPYDKLKNALQSENVIQRFEDVGASAEFRASILSIAAKDNKLAACSVGSILNSCAKAAVLQLPIEPALGYAYVVPFKDEATFILGYKGMVQLAIRTAQYDTINATPIYEGEQIIENRITGELELRGEKIAEQEIGYLAYFRLKNGFNKALYWTTDQVIAHAVRYSPSYGPDGPYNSSAWKTNFASMAKKTVLRQLLGKYGLFSIQYQDADAPPALPGDERMDVPDFDDVVEGEASDVDDSWTEPLIEAGLFQHANHAQNAFRKSDIVFHTDEERMTWSKLYRANSDITGDSDKAAALADAGEVASE